MKNKYHKNKKLNKILNLLESESSKESKSFSKKQKNSFINNLSNEKRIINERKNQK